MMYFLAGYALAVLFPIPFLNSGIISLWAMFGSQIMSWIKGSTGPVPTVPVVPPKPATTSDTPFK
jgi:hypothetical protein